MKKIIVLLLVLIASSSLSFAGEKIAIIANKGVKANTADLATMKNVYALDVTSLGGTKVKLFDYSSDNPSVQALYGAFGKTQTEYKKIWLKAKLTGSGDPPSTVGNEDEMLSKVASTPGAIGYVPISKVNDNVKVLLEIK